MQLCDAKTRSGKPCKAKPMANGKCRMHGGKTPKGADSPNLTHGRYSKYLRQSLQEKLTDIRDEHPLDLLPELEVQRTLFAEYLSRLSEGYRLSAMDISALMGWSAEIGRTVERITKMKNETALTQAEVKFIAMRVVELLGKYIAEPDRRTAFISELFAGIPQLTEGTE